MGTAAEPTLTYIGHVTPATGDSAWFTSSIIVYLAKEEFCMYNLVAVGCDRTVVNTGGHQGVTRRL